MRKQWLRQAHRGVYPSTKPRMGSGDKAALSPAMRGAAQGAVDSPRALQLGAGQIPARQSWESSRIAPGSQSSPAPPAVCHPLPCQLPPGTACCAQHTGKGEAKAHPAHRPPLPAVTCSEGHSCKFLLPFLAWEWGGRTEGCSRLQAG